MRWESNIWQKCIILGLRASTGLYFWPLKISLLWAVVCPRGQGENILYGKIIYWNLLSNYFRHRLSIELDLQILFGLLCTAVLIGWEPATPPLPPHLGSYKSALLVIQDRRHLFVTPCLVALRICWILHGTLHEHLILIGPLFQLK